MKILLATDFSDPSRAAVESAEQSPWPIGAQIRIIHVIDLSLFVPEFTTLDEMKPFAAKALEVTTAEVPRAGLCVTTDVMVADSRLLQGI